MKATLQNIRGTCGQCDHWNRVKDDTGECCALPAVAATDYDDDDGSPVLVFMRPLMIADEWSCIHFKGAN
jgi:hypothetical protein